MKESRFRKLLYRPGKSPSLGIPLGARSVGHYRVGSGPVDPSILRKHFVQVFWGIDGTGEIVIDSISHRLSAGQVGLYLPGMAHELNATSDVWEYRWWTMDGPLAEAVVTEFGLAADVFDVGPAPTDRFAALTAAIADVSADGERRAGVIAYELLSLAARKPAPTGGDPLIEQATGQIERRWADASFGVEVLARQLDIHRSTLSRRFHHAVGVPIGEYLTRLRVQNALSLLRETLLSVAEIARRCGYDDPNYFSRLIRRHTGHSPLQFRKR